ncbi:MAG: MFS transporter [Gammaproteobacteria bacterium]
MPTKAAIAAVYLAALCQGLTLVAVPALSPVLKGTLRLSDSAYGAVFLPQVAATAIAALLGGFLARRFSLKALLVMALIANAGAEMLLLLAPGAGAQVFPLVFASCACLGVGFGLGAAPLNSLPRLLFSTRGDVALVALHTALGAGLCLGPLLAGHAVMSGAWTAYPALLAGFALVLTALTSRLNLPRLTAATSIATPAVRGGDCGLLVVIAVLYAFAEGTFSNWAITYLNEDRGIDAGTAALALSVFWGALVLGRLLISALIVRVRAAVIWQCLPLLMIAVFGALPYVTSAAGGLLIFAAAGAACSAFFPLTVARASARFSGNEALMGSIMTAALMLGIGAGTFVIAPLRNLFGLPALYHYSIAYPLIVFCLCRIEQGRGLTYFATTRRAEINP